MSQNNTMISDPELHAYVDGTLPEERRAVSITGNYSAWLTISMPN